jgi:hypothetical protein
MLPKGWRARRRIDDFGRRAACRTLQRLCRLAAGKQTAGCGHAVHEVAAADRSIHTEISI